jgi:hypothetical protein
MSERFLHFIELIENVEYVVYALYSRRHENFQNEDVTQEILLYFCSIVLHESIF